MISQKQIEKIEKKIAKVHNQIYHFDKRYGHYAVTEEIKSKRRKLYWKLYQLECLAGGLEGDYESKL